MEQNLPVLAKKVWNLVRVVYFMLRKGISKRKLLLDLNMMIRRGKIAGKALQNLMFHHYHINREAFTAKHRSYHLSFPSPPPGEYEFSCSNSPAPTTHHPFSLFSLHKKHHSNSKPSKDHLDMMAVNAVLKAMEMIHSDNSSPALPGFGSTPMVRQLRVTDSPFPLSSVDQDNKVDEAAEEFISRFYNDLRLQKAKASSFGSS
ncbi:uncharacterized protein LOC111907892 [Lactuca sativa]|uniref:Avr9/Cf-9 rapidly elicited protein 146 n=1 Tax=Lactuca sativa TaxID=4236 RepID=A0A9R1VST5_LACSA|nr:uncharacterized protein LOC111907892 [Lactuca sativa]KAJ0209936.1 hypothetical protein LSAT_V11C400196790 [Lactuca sativa]